MRGMKTAKPESVLPSGKKTASDELREVKEEARSFVFLWKGDYADPITGEKEGFVCHGYKRQRKAIFKNVPQGRTGRRKDSILSKGKRCFLFYKKGKEQAISTEQIEKEGPRSLFVTRGSPTCAGTPQK